MKNRYVVLLFVLSCVSMSVIHAQLKKRVAVMRFEDRTGSGYHSLGEGVSDMLTTALVKSGNFLVVERQEIEKAIQEQQFGESFMVTPETAPKMGKVIGVELMVIGSVSEFGVQESGVSGGVSLFGGGISKRTARAAVDVRLVNISTGEIIAAEKSEGEESSTGFSINTAEFDFSNSNSWTDTDIGKATRKAVTSVVQLITENIGKVPWQGRILRVNPDGTVLMKPGSEGNIKTGMEFDVFRKGEDIIDPDTGQSLGSEDERIASIKVVQDMLQGKASKANVTSGSGIQAGDIVRQKE